uniref:Cocaine- and amphetamine-regulated transcript protein n=1 Tax=Anas platyrhynchos platyrhynchos TaxID=8840 RepID=A0A493TDD9_ANAPP
GGGHQTPVTASVLQCLPREPCAVRMGVEALQDVLEKLRGRELPAAKTKLGRVPSCLPREPCAVRMGARFGTRCSCPPGTACNLHVLECS